MNTRENTQGFSLKDKTVCLIGCGGLGCNIAVHLVGAGIGKLYLCDFDTVSRGNLNRQFLYTEKDIGEYKCERAKEFLSAYSDDTVIESYTVKIKELEDADFAYDSDIIICAVDNRAGRSASESLAYELDIPLVIGGIDGFYGMAYLLIPGESPCLSCAGMDTPDNARYNISSTAGIIGSAQAGLVINYLTTRNKNLSGKLLIYDEDRFDTLKITPAKDCPVCSLY